MTPAADPGLKALTALLKRLAEHVTPAPVPVPDPALIDPAEPLLAEFLRSMLVWEAGSGEAAAALKRIARSVVDFNELRVCLPDEIVAVLGQPYPRAAERALRLRAALNELYVREHAVTLQPLAAMGKREAKAYLDSLEGVPPFASARVSLVCLGVHAAPVDDRILRRLIEAGVVPTGSCAEAAGSALERKVRAGEMSQAYALLQAWADELPASAPPPVPTAAAAAPAPPPPAKPSKRSVAARSPANGEAERKAEKGGPAPRAPSKGRKGGKQ